MQKPRRVNTIRALKEEISFYKRQPVRFGVVDRTQLKHIKLISTFSPFEVATMKKDAISDLLLHRMSEAFKDYIINLPINKSYDEELNVYRADIDLWVRESDNSDT